MAWFWDDPTQKLVSNRGNTERIIKSALKRQLKRSGLHLFTDGSLPPGVNWLLDIKKLGLPTSATFFDVGANIGQTVFEVCESFPEARIFSFEPFPSTFGTLKERTAHLKHVRVFPLALGASPVTLQVNVRETSVMNSLVGANKSTESELPRSGAIPITVKTLDHFCAENRQNTPFAPLFDYLTPKNFHFLGLYETYPLHHFCDFNFFCNAMFVHRSQPRRRDPSAFCTNAEGFLVFRGR